MLMNPLDCGIRSYSLCLDAQCLAPVIDFTKYKIENQTLMVLQEPANNLEVYVKAETQGGAIQTTKASILICGFETISSVST